MVGTGVFHEEHVSLTSQIMNSGPLTLQVKTILYLKTEQYPLLPDVIEQILSKKDLNDWYR